MVFRPVQALTDKEMPVVLPMRDGPMTFRITGEHDSGDRLGQVSEDDLLSMCEKIRANNTPMPSHENGGAVEDDAENADTTPGPARAPDALKRISGIYRSRRKFVRGLSGGKVTGLHLP